MEKFDVSYNRQEILYNACLVTVYPIDGQVTAVHYDDLGISSFYQSAYQVTLCGQTFYQENDYDACPVIMVYVEGVVVSIDDRRCAICHLWENICHSCDHTEVTQNDGMVVKTSHQLEEGDDLQEVVP